MWTRRVGFLVDAAVLGFAVGAGFALVENVVYLRAITDAPLGLWLVRGLGTAVMHGGTTAMFAMLARTLVDRYFDPAAPTTRLAMQTLEQLHADLRQEALPRPDESLAALAVAARGR